MAAARCPENKFGARQPGGELCRAAIAGAMSMPTARSTTLAAARTAAPVPQPTSRKRSFGCRLSAASASRCGLAIKRERRSRS